MTTAEIRDMQVLLGRIETKLDSALAEQADHATRISRLEKAAYILVGLLASAGVAVSPLVGLVTGS